MARPSKMKDVTTLTETDS